jgi:hypothetical protein
MAILDEPPFAGSIRADRRRAATWEVAEQTHVVHPFDLLRPTALRTRDELREHFRPTDVTPRLHRRPANITIHETTDPEVIVAEFEYQGTNADTGERFALPAIVVLRVRTAAQTTQTLSGAMPTGQVSPVGPIPQYPFLLRSRYCWW